MVKRTGKRGRPKKAPGDGKTVTFAMRATPADLLRIDQEAVAAGKSRSRYILDTLSSKMSAAEDRRPDIREVMNLCEKVLRYAERFAGIDWYENIFMPAIIGAALQRVLAQYGNREPMTVPAKIAELALDGQEPPSTPAEVARIIWMAVVADLELSETRGDPENPAMLSRVVLRNERRPEEDRVVIPAQWAKDAQTLHVLRSLKSKED